MALVCGTTSDGCFGKAGKIVIEATIPDAAFVRYKYPTDANWSQVQGATRYTTEIKTISATPGQGNGIRYRIRVYTQANLRIADSRGDRYEGTYYPSFTATNQFIGPITSIVIRRTDFFGGANRNMSMQVAHAGGISTFSSLQPYTSPDGGGSIKSLPSGAYWQLPTPPPDYPLLNLRITRVDGLPEDTSGRTECVFKVFNEQNVVMLELTRDVCPEAIAIPSTYGSNLTKFVVGNLKANPLRIVNSELSGRKSTTVFLGNTPIKKIDSPLGATLFPRVCWDCTEDEKCPEGTCEVDCGDRICCINAMGMPVKEIKK